jgi:hypothetical protein
MPANRNTGATAVWMVAAMESTESIRQCRQQAESECLLSLNGEIRTQSVTNDRPLQLLARWMRATGRAR